MRILLIGGTRFVGKHIVAAAMDAAHEVTIFTRGRTGPDLFPEAERRHGDRNEDLSALADGQWDATIDTCAYLPHQVESLADALGGRAGHYLLISSVSAYAQPEGAGYTEAAALAELEDPTTEAITEETYGGLKVLCERSALDRFGSATTIVRPTYVVGPDDYTWRFPFWVERLARGGEVLVPGPRDTPAQVIDARDMGAWIVNLLDQDRAGAFHAVSPPPPFSWQQLLETIAATVAPDGTELTWVDEQFCRDRGLDEESFPLWSGSDPAGLLMAADPSAAFATGLRPRALTDTIRDTLVWAQENERPPDVGYSESQEKEALRSYRP